MISSNLKVELESGVYNQWNENPVEVGTCNSFTAQRSMNVWSSQHMACNKLNLF